MNTLQESPEHLIYQAILKEKDDDGNIDNIAKTLSQSKLITDLQKESISDEIDYIKKATLLKKFLNKTIRNRQLDFIIDKQDTDGLEEQLKYFIYKNTESKKQKNIELAQAHPTSTPQSMPTNSTNTLNQTNNEAAKELDELLADNINARLQNIFYRTYRDKRHDNRLLIYLFFSALALASFLVTLFLPTTASYLGWVVLTAFIGITANYCFNSLNWKRNLRKRNCFGLNHHHLSTCR